jgi:hypothetical protein
MAEFEGAYARFNPDYRDKYNRRIQVFDIVNEETNEPSREHYLDLDEALEILNDNFQFENGRQYILKLNTGQGWKSRGNIFTFRDGMNLYNEIYNEQYEIAQYGGDALDKDSIRVYGIILEDRTEEED